jgi:predicted dithiol-disulfide oxidoreductase (DUF899 family)
MSVFYKDSDGSVFHTYSTYGRGLEPLLLPYHVLDMTPKGRDEQDQVPFPMAWVRHHDRYPETPSGCSPASWQNPINATGERTTGLPVRG